MPISRAAFISLALPLAMIMPPIADAQLTRVVHWSARSTASVIRAGDTTHVFLHAKIEEFFHLYSTTQGPGGPIKTTVALVPNRSWMQLGKLRVPPPDTIPDRNFGIMSEVYDDSLTIGLTIRALPTAEKSDEPLQIAVRHQSCTTRYCLPPRTDTVLVPVRRAAARRR